MGKDFPAERRACKKAEESLHLGITHLGGSGGRAEKVCRQAVRSFVHTKLKVLGFIL